MITVDYHIPYFTITPTSDTIRRVVMAYGWKWDKVNKRCVHYDIRRVAPFAKYNITDKAKEVILRTRNSKAQNATSTEFPCPEGLSYLPYQKAGIEFMANTKRCLLADEPGTGKTIQIAGLINLIKPKKVLILCPASLRLNWKKELKKWCQIDASTEFDAKSDTMVMSYDSLVSGGRFSKLRVMDFDLVALDESHYCKNIEASRTQNTLGIVRSCDRVVWMSGTPLVNRPIELFTMLNFLSEEYFADERRYAFKYCDAHYRYISFYKAGRRVQKKVLDKGGATNMEELNAVLTGNFMLRRLKKDVLTQLPKKVRQVIEFPLKKSDLKNLHELEEGYVDMPEDKLEELVLSKGFDISELAKLRKVVGEIKIPFAIEHIKNLLFSLDKIVIFCHHRIMVETLFEQLAEFNPVKIMGGMKDSDKQESVDRFQNDKDVRVFIGNIQAAGVGITLTAASTVVFVEIVPVPGLMTQAEDRCVRIGATADSVLIQHLVLEDSLDKRLCELIVKKQKVSDKILDGGIMDWSKYTAKVDGEKLVFSNGESIEYYHEQDCCEHVYVAWEEADELLFSSEFSGEPEIEFVENAGIRVNKCFVPCYNQQNGYYSSDLELKFSWKEEKVDISAYVKDEID